LIPLFASRRASYSPLVVEVPDEAAVYRPSMASHRFKIRRRDVEVFATWAIEASESR
jgi:hypothetical protein